MVISWLANQDLTPMIIALLQLLVSVLSYTVRSERQQKGTTYFLIVITLTTDPVSRFHDEDYSAP